ncbi:hypothetical protein AAE250_18415 [Bacteroides sp. GD17]|mgnify:FL=1|jgi:hypothetical protein|uniref:hypothetical protein n=1 Tax=Bacteroides sp. GD17 TaxID=3139826 RepID=UPI0025E1B51A|nr:hypothetical protein [uncultured Bacteroides sp.]
MEQKTRQQYIPPTIEVIPLESESVIAGSPGGGGTSDMPIQPLNTARRGRSYGAASTSELEDLINDILTVEQ